MFVMTLRIISFIVLIDVIIGAKLINCPIDSIRYERIIGLQPPEKYQKLLLYQQQQQQPILIKCLEKCNQLDDCQNFIIIYNTSTCYWYKQTIIEDYLSLNQNEYNINIVWFKKICLINTTNINNCNKKLWIFDRIPGTTLIDNNTKTIDKYLTRTECQQACIDEKQFDCRSIKFKINYSNNNNEINGICILSNTDRFLSPNSFRISNYDEEYYENQCSRKLSNNNQQFCAYDEYENSTLLYYHDLTFINITKDSCQQLCDNTTIINCKSFSLYEIKQNNYLCYLHTIDSKILGPKQIKYDPNGRYYEKSRCLNLTIICTETEMIINYLPQEHFYGNLYMDGYLDNPSCTTVGNGYSLITLKLSLIQMNNCGLIRAKSPTNRTLITAKLILQYHRYIQTQNDRIIRIGCIFNNNSKIIVGSGITITTNTTKPNSHLFNITNTNDNPTIQMRIVDFNTKQELSNTEIGQELQLIIELIPKTSYDLRAYDLIAMTETGDDSIYLLDDNGCPTNPNIFPQLTKSTTNQSRQLIARFQAFKFTSSSIVRFSVIVEFCTKTCPNYNCNNQRYKREFIDNTKITNINRNEFDNSLKDHGQIPLELVMIVRNSSVIADRLVIGDRKILVAGYDFINNEVCLDYSLFIGMIITWILVQLIFFICGLMIVRHYKNLYETELTRSTLSDLDKNFDLGYTNRHVHWADNEEFT